MSHDHNTEAAMTYIDWCGPIGSPDDAVLGLEDMHITAEQIYTYLSHNRRHYSWLNEYPETALIGDILLQKSASSISSEQANLQEGCCGVKDCRCGDACPKKIGARPVFPPNMLVSETGLRLGAYFPTKDKPKDGDPPKSGSGVENS